jgi:hypothetical protein
MNTTASKTLIMMVTAIILGGGLFSPAQATVYFSWGNEDGACGEDLPNPPFKPWESRKDATGQTICAPDGSRFFQWQVADHQHDAYNRISTSRFPVRVIPGRTYYLAFRVNFHRHGNKDVWHNTPASKSGECFDKFIEIVGGQRLRWIVHFGEKGMMTPQGSFSTFLSSFSHGMNPEVEEWGIYFQNYNGYSRYSPKLLEYETWYQVVMAVTMATDKTGAIALYIDGEKITDYRNIKTMEENGSIDFIGMNGTLAQHRYDINAHTRKVSNLLLTDDWQEIAARGYMRPPENTPRPVSPPAPPPDFWMPDN